MGRGDLSTVICREQPQEVPPRAQEVLGSRQGQRGIAGRWRLDMEMLQEAQQAGKTPSSPGFSTKGKQICVLL